MKIDNMKIDNMKIVFIIIIIISQFFNCSKIIQENELIGNWSSVNSSNNIDFQFFKDSLLIDQWGSKYNYKWKADDLYIYLDSLEANKPFDKYNSTYIYNYKIDKDTLFIREIKTDTSFLKLIKINNAFDYFNKNIRLDIQLPIESNLTPILDEEFAYILYVTFKNNNMTVKTPENLIVDMNDLEKDINIHIANTEISDESKICYMLFIDKNVPKKEVEKIKSMLKRVNNKKIFQVYTNEKIDYTRLDWKDKIKWYGIFE